MTEYYAHIAKKNDPMYKDIYGNTVALSFEEQEYFRHTVSEVLAAVGIQIPVYMCDHERLPGKSGDALGMYWKNESGDEFITIDNYFIHESYQVAFCGAYDLNGETLASVLCHELAHIRYFRHTKYHAELTEKYIACCETRLNEMTA